MIKIKILHSCRLCSTRVVCVALCRTRVASVWRSCCKLGWIACCPLHNVYFSDMQINRWQNLKDNGHHFTLNLQMTATKIRRISLIRTFFIFLWINLFCSIADVYYRNFLKFWYCCAEKYFVFYPIFHETFSYSCGFALI